MSGGAPSIAILPFENLSGTAEDERLALGFAHDLIAELARFPNVQVLAADSAFSLQGADESGRSRRLGADYLLKGSIRRSARALRVAAHLVEANSGRHVWAERYDTAADEFFAVEDDVAAKVANALTLRIDQEMLNATRRRRIRSLAAYECWLRGMECLQRGTIEADDEARGYFEQALRVDPTFARARAGLSLSHFNEWSCQAWDCWAEKEKAAYEQASQAEQLDPNDPLVQVILAKISQYRREHRVAESRYRRALELAPSDAFVCIQLAVGFALLGDAKPGAELGARALALNPLRPAWWYYYAAVPHFVLRDYRTSLEIGERSPGIVTDGPAYLAAAHACLGEHEEARNRGEEFRAIFRERITRGREPLSDEAFRWLIHVNPYRNEEDMAHFCEGLRRAGFDGGDPQPAQEPRPKPWPLDNTFRREGDLWMVCFEREVAHVPGVRGFEDIARLLARPGGELHCTELAGESFVASEGTPVLDERTRRDFRQRLHEIERDLESAEGDAGRLEELTEEKERLLDELRRATGLDGRGRRMSDGTERARAAVTWRIRAAIRKLEPVHPALARHLANAIKTGTFCSYRPERETRWLV
jgi:Predicted integral membrane protein